MKMRLETYKMATFILLQFLTLKFDISRTIWFIELTVSVPAFVDNSPLKESRKIKPKTPTSSKGKAPKGHRPVSSEIQHHKPDIQTRKVLLDFEKFRGILEKLTEELIGERMLTEQKEIDEFIRKLCDVEIASAELKQAEEAAQLSGSEDIKITVEEDKGKELEPIKEDTGLCNQCGEKPNIDHAGLFLSVLFANGAAKLKECTLYEYLLSTFREKNSDEVCLPTPMIPLLSCELGSPGKLNMVKRLYMLPKTGIPCKKALSQGIKLYQELGNALSQKFGLNGRLMDSECCYMPSFDKLEQVFEFLQAALTLAEVSFETDVDLMLNVGASDFFDEDKKRYEIITGSHKSTDDLIAMYVDLVERYPIIGIIDGLSNKDTEGWLQLNKQIGERCFVFGDQLYNNQFEDVIEKIQEKTSSGLVLRLGSYSSTLTELKKICDSVSDIEGQVIMTGNTSQDCTATLVPDLATTLGCTFISLGSPQHSEYMQLYNRLLEIEEELSAAGKLKSRDSYQFPVINVEELTEEDSPEDSESPS